MKKTFTSAIGGISILLLALLVSGLAFAMPHAASAHTSNVSLLQRDLAGLSYLSMSGVDGIYGPETTNAVRHFQSDNSLQVDGDAGPQTMGTLQNKVKAVQHVARVTADGDYGPNTILGVERYQSRHGLEVDGIAGPQTMGAMAIPRIVGETSSGSSDVRLLQRDLAGLAYLPMSGIDGIYGPQTTDAVLSFQSDNGLVIDGIAGPQTMGALENKVEAVQSTAGTSVDGDYGPLTTAAVEKYQRIHRLEVDGIAGPQTMHSMRISRESGGNRQSGGAIPNPPHLSGSTRDKIVQAARSQLGIHEWGDNCNPYGPCEYWCALFASWTWRQAGINFSTAFSGDFYYYGLNHHTLHNRLSNPEPGDAILFGTGPQNVSTSVHVGIIVQVLSNGEVISIEGNYSNQVMQVGPYLPLARGAYAIVSPD